MYYRPIQNLSALSANVLKNIFMICVSTNMRIISTPCIADSVMDLTISTI